MALSPAPPRHCPLERAFAISDEAAHQDAKDQNSRARLAMAGLAMPDILRHTDAGRALAVYDYTLRHLAEIRDNVVMRRFKVDAMAGSTYTLRRPVPPLPAGGWMAPSSD